jgi:hypothetical protein
VFLEIPDCISTALGLPLTEEWRDANPFAASLVDGMVLLRNLFLSLVLWNILCAMYGYHETVVSSQTAKAAKRNAREIEELGHLLGEDDLNKLLGSRKELQCARCGITQSAAKARAGGGSLAGCSGCTEHSADSLQASPVAYCSKECQKAHWKVHKPVCGKTRAALLRYSDGSLRSPALVQQIEQLQSKEAIAQGIDYILFTDQGADQNIGVSFQTMGSLLFDVLKKGLFHKRPDSQSVCFLYEALREQLPDLPRRFTEAELRRQLKAEYGIDPLEVKDDTDDGMVDVPSTTDDH